MMFVRFLDMLSFDKIFLIILFRFQIIQSYGQDWLLYLSTPLFSVPYYDCLLLDSIWYCRRPTNVSQSRVLTLSCPERNKQLFSTLRAQNTTTNELLDWNIPVDVIQSYGYYLSLNSVANQETTDQYICNCTGSKFGSNCEYLSPDIKSAPSLSLRNRLTDPKYVTFYDQWCLVDIQCNMGLSCLDWRYVCDGIEHCQFGEDELHCERLEFNECEINEYRCRNGMCIPQEWFFDGIFDCQDESDEHRLERYLKDMKKCQKSLFRFECAERLCNSKQPYSCGDGECLSWQNLYDQQDTCNNNRDLFHRCEIKTPQRFSTIQNDGSCALFSSAEKNLTEDNQCTKAFRQLLSRNTNSTESFEKHCDLHFNFPQYPFISSNVHTRYNKTIISSNILFEIYYSLKDTARKPHYHCFSGCMTCSGILTFLNQSFCLSSIDILTQYSQWPYRYIPCSSSFANPQPSFITKFSNLYQCKSNQRLINKQRLNDGYQDCFHGEDEFMLSNESMIHPYRYRCSSLVPIQYVSTTLLGNGERNCQDGSDEISPVVNWFTQQCLPDNLYTCEILRNDDKIRQVRLRFQYYCNSLWDTWDGNDERNCTNWICSNTFIQCNQTGQCIRPAWRCDGEWDCANGEDELNCNFTKARFFLENQCNHTKEFFCITPDFIRDPKTNHPCIHYSKAGDGNHDCLGARDERNIYQCKEDNQMLGNRFRCVNGTCLSTSHVCDGIDDCQDGADEQICYWIWKTNQTNSSYCSYPKFQCFNGICTEYSRCHIASQCSHNEHLFWCFDQDMYRQNKKPFSNYHDFCMSTQQQQASVTKIANDISIQTSSMEAPIPYSQIPSLFCNHGLMIEENTPTGWIITCFCPSNYYGDRCQYFSRRIPIRVSLDRLHRTDLNRILHIYIFLICNHTRIIDYTQFIDFIDNLNTKYDRYLLYTRPKLSCQYSVRFEIYHSDISDVRLLLVWEFSIPLDFLPSHRLAKILRFPLIETHPIPLHCMHSICQNNGTCHIILNKQDPMDSYCECSPGFYGRFCEKRMNSTSCSCAPRAKCHIFEYGLLDIKQAWFCICPEGFLPPYCHLKNPVCLSNPCQHNGTCYAHSEIGNYTCLCDKQYRGRRCEIASVSITVYSNPKDEIESYFPHAFLLQLFAIQQGFLILRQQTLIDPHQLPLKISFDSRRTFTELGLIQFFERDISSVRLLLHLLYINCTNQTDGQYAINILDSVKCQNLLPTNENNIHIHIYEYHDICRQNSSIPCFHTPYYFCRCTKNPSRAECVLFHLDLIECHQKDICLNQGQCIHGNRLNRSDFVCICPLCTQGRLCQYTFTRFSLTLETLFVSSPLSYQYHLIIPILMFIFALIFNGLSIYILYKVLHRKIPLSLSKKLSFGGCSLYLLVKSIVSQITLLFLLLRVIYLSLINISQLDHTINLNLCKSLPYFMSSSWFVSSWMTAFVTITRSLSIVRPKSWLFIRSSRFAFQVILITFIIVFLSCITYLFSYTIVSDTNGKQSESWCVLELSSSKMIYIRIATIVHQIVPFIFNIIATIVLLLYISRNKANLHHQAQFTSFIQVLYDRLEFLLGPSIAFITQLPQIVILFFDGCQFVNSYWFMIGTLAAYYLTFVPQIVIFFMYILPSPLYKEELQKIKIFKQSQ